MQHLLTTDALSWSVLSCIRLTEEDTTSSSRIFIKILFQDLSENLGLMSLNQRLQEPTLQMFFAGIFPKVCPHAAAFLLHLCRHLPVPPCRFASQASSLQVPPYAAALPLKLFQHLRVFTFFCEHVQQHPTFEHWAGTSHRVSFCITHKCQAWLPLLA